MLSLGILILELILAEELTLAECHLEIQSLNERLIRLEQMYEENSKDIHFLIDENSKIRDELDNRIPTNQFIKVESSNDENDDKDEHDEIYSQFIGPNGNVFSH